MRRIKVLFLIFLPLIVVAKNKVGPAKMGNALLDTVSVEFYKKNIEEPVLSRLYRRGQNLIYDCESKHFGCVNDESYKRCVNQGEKYYEVFGNLCLKLKTFPDQPACFKEHLRLMDKNMMHVFCERIKR